MSSEGFRLGDDMFVGDISNINLKFAVIYIFFHMK